MIFTGTMCMGTNWSRLQARWCTSGKWDWLPTELWRTNTAQASGVIWRQLSTSSQNGFHFDHHREHPSMISGLGWRLEIWSLARIRLVWTYEWVILDILRLCLQMKVFDTFVIFHYTLTDGIISENIHVFFYNFPTLKYSWSTSPWRTT